MQKVWEHLFRLLNSSDFVDLLVNTLKYRDLDVQQSSFGCLGELGKACPQFIIQLLPKIIPECMRAMDNATASGYTAEGDENINGDNVTNVCNNAIWSLGEIVIKVGPGPIQSYLGRILNK